METLLLPGQVPSHVNSDLAISGQPNSKMIENKWKPKDHADMNACINIKYSFLSLPYPQLILNLILADILNILVEWSDNEVNTKEMIKGHKWLQNLLMEQWKSQLFTKVYHLSKYPLYIFPMDDVT